MLLTRDNFRNKVFERDNHKCVICGAPAQDAHHIIERRLFTDGGYYLDNGASVCGEHHIGAEETTISCATIREKAGITKIILPDHLYRDQEYDKWGNIELPNGQRIKGELFYDESVQKILAQGGVLGLFQKHIKYPRTYHLPWSNLLKDDRQMESDDCFHNKRVIVSLKCDGENTSMYNDHIHARSLDSGSHPSRDWVKGLWGQIAYMIDPQMRVCGENLYAKHTIHYEGLTSYFKAFSVWVDNVCLSWDETLEYLELLGLEPVDVIYDGIYDRKKIIEIFEQYPQDEGYVVRIADEFTYGGFRTHVGKYVRPEFRQQLNDSHGHWISKKIIPNKLK